MTALSEQMNLRFDDEDLPVLSVVANRARTLINSGQPTAEDLERVIVQDAALASRILRLSNSPVYGGKVTFSKVSQAVVRLGTKTLEKTILIAAVGEVFPLDDAFALNLWEHSVATGQVGYWLSGRLKVGDPDECFLAGILHDIGKLMIYHQAKEPYCRLMDQAQLQRIRLHEYERYCIKPYTHEWVGGILGRKWGLTPEIIDAVRFHHSIEEDDQCVAATRTFVALISLANLIANDMGFRASPHYPIDVPASKPAQILGVEDELFQEAKTTLGPLVEEHLSSLHA